MKLTADWLSSETSQTLMGCFDTAGYKALFVGGCVRNTLLDHPVSDMDVATDATPKEVLDTLGKAGIRTIPTGIEHGTVTAIVGEIAYEITTFRKDVETDGRRATVAFSGDIEDDAKRRDFTMNALYAKADGTVVDPLGGIDDLKACKVRFIEDAETRIREDYLRILRFFRFHAWFGDPTQGLDADGLAACASLADGVLSLSKERIGAEMNKLLSAPDPSPDVAAMRSTGVLALVLPGADDRFLAPLVHLEEDAVPEALRRLAVLGGEDVAQALRLSKKDARHLDLLRSEMAGVMSAGELGYRHGVETGHDALLLRAAIANRPVSPKDIEALELGQAAEFPVKAQDLMPDLDGPVLGQRLADLEAKWIASGFRLRKSDLLS